MTGPTKVFGANDDWLLYRPDEFRPGKQLGQNGEITLRKGTPEYDYFIACQELQNRHDLRHGMSHLARLLRFDPNRTEWLVLLDSYLLASEGDPHSLLPDETSPDLTPAFAAVRAYLFATRDNRLEDAVQLFLTVAQHDPVAEYIETWGLNLLEREGAFESLSSDTATTILALALNRFGECATLTERQRRLVARYAKLAERYDRCFEGNEMTLMTRAGLLRKAGLLDEALALLRGPMTCAATWHIAIARGLVLRQMGCAAESVATFQQASQLDPDDLSSLVEAADTWFEEKQWDKALALYRDVLRRENAHPWATPSALYCQWRLAPVDHAALQDFPQHLVQLAQADPPNERAQAILSQYRLKNSGDTRLNSRRSGRQTLAADRARRQGRRRGLVWRLSR